MRSFPLLDGYRAIAAFMVLTTHVAFNTGEILTPVLGPLLGRMDFGVTLFFLLSGFLLYRPWARAAMEAGTGPRLGGYALRRAARIFPAYWAMVVFTLLLLPEIQPVEWQAWPVHLGLLHIYIPGFTLEGLTQTWSLAT
ncbi:MAG: acyltransferase family protein, partial [Candidatus Nanopelagicales bacterium]